MCQRIELITFNQPSRVKKKYTNFLEIPSLSNYLNVMCKYKKVTRLLRKK